MKRTVVEVTRLTRLKLSCGHYAMPDYQIVTIKPGDAYDCSLCFKSRSEEKRAGRAAMTTTETTGGHICPICHTTIPPGAFHACNNRIEAFLPSPYLTYGVPFDLQARITELEAQVRELTEKREADPRRTHHRRRITELESQLAASRISHYRECAAMCGDVVVSVRADSDVSHIAVMLRNRILSAADAGEGTWRIGDPA